MSMSAKKKTKQPMFVTEFDAELTKLNDTINDGWDAHHKDREASERALYKQEQVAWKVEQKRDKARRKLVIKANADSKKAAGNEVGAIWTEYAAEWWDTEGTIPSQIKVLGEKDVIHTAKTMVEAKLISKGLQLSHITPAKKAKPKK